MTVFDSFLFAMCIGTVGVVVVYVLTLLIGRAANRTYRERLKIEKEEQEKDK